MPQDNRQSGLQSLAEPSPFHTAGRQVGFAQAHTRQLGAAQIGADQARTVQIGARHLRPGHGCEIEHAIGEVCGFAALGLTTCRHDGAAAKVGVVEIGIVQLRSLQATCHNSFETTGVHVPTECAEGASRLQKVDAKWESSRSVGGLGAGRHGV